MVIKTNQNAIKIAMQSNWNQIKSIKYSTILRLFVFFCGVGVHSFHQILKGILWHKKVKKHWFRLPDRSRAGTMPLKASSCMVEPGIALPNLIGHTVFRSAGNDFEVAHSFTCMRILFQPAASPLLRFIPNPPDYIILLSGLAYHDVKPNNAHKNLFGLCIYNKTLFLSFMQLV